MSLGIDYHIDHLVDVFNSKLWSSKNRHFVGRIFRNMKGSKIVPSKSIDGSNEYQISLKNDNYDAQCFFDVLPEETILNGVHHATVYVCFMVNLVSIYPLFNRVDATEKVHADIEFLLKRLRIDFIELVRGIKSFEDYDMESVSINDMSPNYLFRYTIKVNYTNSNC